MKKLLRAAVLTVVMFAGANAQAVRDQDDDVREQQTISAVGPGTCYWVQGRLVCDS